MTEFFEDEDLGIIRIVRNAKAKRIIARRNDSSTVSLTVPSYYPIDEIKSVFGELKPRLLELKPKNKPFFDESYRLDTIAFSVSIRKEAVQNYYVSLKESVLHIVCPSHINFDTIEVQERLGKYIESAFRLEANKIIPHKISLLAKQNGFTFTDIKINKSKTRWGSCSSKKSINISLFCLLLPEHLLDFVLLHELCHTIEMNHGEKFWQLLDRVTQNKARQLTKELNSIKMNS